MNRTSPTRHAVWKGLTFRELVAAAMVERPTEPFITEIGLSGEPLHFSPRAFDHIATRVARRFATAGAKPGDAILIALPNGAACLLALLGALGAGLTPCLAPPTLSESAIALLLQRLKPRALVSASRPEFDPLSAYVTQARRLAMPLYIWNFGPNDHDHAAPLSDLLDGQAPQRMAPLHPPFSGDGAIFTIADFGRGPEPVTHRQDALLAQAIIARMTKRTAPAARSVSAISVTTQAGLVLGPMRALLAGAHLTLIADPAAASIRAAAEHGPADWILPQTIAARLRESGLTQKDGPITTLYRAGMQLHHPGDDNGFVAFGEAITLPLIRNGKALAPGTIQTSSADGPLHFATLATDEDNILQIESQLAGRLTSGALACPTLYTSVAPDGTFTRFINQPWEKRHASSARD